MNTTVLEAATNATVAANAEALIGSVVMPTINVPANATFSLEGSDEEAIRRLISTSFFVTWKARLTQS